MEIKINKEIRSYSESVFLGLSLRQVLCSVLAIAFSVLSYCSLSDVLSKTAVSYIAILAAAPFALLGFARFNAMPFEKYLRALFIFYFLQPRYFVCTPKNTLMELCMPVISSHGGSP